MDPPREMRNLSKFRRLLPASSTIRAFPFTREKYNRSFPQAPNAHKSGMQWCWDVNSFLAFISVEEEQAAVVIWELLSLQIARQLLKVLVFQALKLARPNTSDQARASPEANHLEFCLQLQKNKGK